jgi:hypothetical protein
MKKQVRTTRYQVSNMHPETFPRFGGVVEDTKKKMLPHHIKAQHPMLNQELNPLSPLEIEVRQQRGANHLP